MSDHWNTLTAEAEFGHARGHIDSPQSIAKTFDHIRSEVCAWLHHRFPEAQITMSSASRDVSIRIPREDGTTLIVDIKLETHQQHPTYTRVWASASATVTFSEEGPRVLVDDTEEILGEILNRSVVV